MLAVYPFTFFITENSNYITYSHSAEIILIKNVLYNKPIEPLNLNSGYWDGKKNPTY